MKLTRRLTLVGLLTSISMICVSSATQAYTGPVWQQLVKECLKEPKKMGKWDGQGNGVICANKNAKNEGEWEEYWVQASVASPVTVHAKGSLHFSDMGAKITLQCSVSFSGTVSAEGKGGVTEALTTSCTTVEGACGAPKITFIDLSWATQLETSGLNIINTSTANGKGLPGWTIVCFGFVEDTCTGANSATAKNVTAGVELAIATSGSEEMNCTVGGVKTGLMNGTYVVENPPENELTVK